MSIKEIWSKLKYWQRGGVVAAILGTVLFYILAWNIFVPHPQKIGTILLLISSFLFSPIYFPYFLISEFLQTWSEYLIYLLSIVFYFSVGASIAHVIYENKNSVSSYDNSKQYTRKLALAILSFYILITFIVFILILLLSEF